MNTKKTICNTLPTFVLIIFLLNNGITQQGSYLYEKLDTKSGLAQNTVNCILQDSRGYMWFGTEYGLSKYDGYTFTNYIPDPLDSSSIGGYKIMDILEDAYGDLWISTGNTISCLSDENFCKGKFVNYNLTIIFDLEISKQYPDSIIWAATNKGLMIFNKKTGQIKKFSGKQNLSVNFGKNFICKLLEDSRGNLWVGTNHSGLFCIKNVSTENERIIYFSENSISDFYNSKLGIPALLEDSKGNIWVGINGGGIIKIPPGAFNELDFIHYHQNAPTDLKIGCDYISHSIVEDKNGMIWFSSDGGGLMKFDICKKKFVYFKHNPQLSDNIGSNRIMSFFIDNNGLWWAGSKDKGIIKIINNSPCFNRFPVRLNKNVYKKIENINVWTIKKSRDKNRFWVGVDHGLCLIEKIGRNAKTKKQKNDFTKISEFTFNSENNANFNNLQIRDIYEDPDGILWIATLGMGLIRLNTLTGEYKIWQNSVDFNGSIPSNSLYCIEKNANNLWLGLNNGGLTRFNIKTEQFKEYYFRDIPGDMYFITSLKKSKLIPHSIWVGEWNHGLILFNTKKGKFQFYHQESSNTNNINKNSITTIFEDKQNIWLGTYGGGLIRGIIQKAINDETGKPQIIFKRYMPKDGLGNEMIYGILKDDLGNLWLSTNIGLSCFNPESEIFTNFTFDDGLPAEGFNLGACLKNKGQLHFGGGDGIYHFNPAQQINEKKPKVVLTAFKKFGKPIKNIPLDKIEELELSYKDDFFSFEFAALSFKNPNKNQYAYKMEGFNENWINIGHKHEAIYTNLAPGNYVFKVKAANSDGVWNENALNIKVIINSPLWKTWWLYIIGSSIILILIYIAHRMLLFRILKIREKLQAALARDFHDDTGGYIAGIRTAGYNLLNSNEEDKHKMASQIAKQSDKLSNAVKDLLFEIDPDKSSLMQLIIYLKDHSDDVFENTSIAFQIAGLKDEFDKVYLPSNWKANLLRIFKEGMNNIIKHCPESKNVILEIKINKKFLKMKLKDDGCGIAPQKISNGNGIKNLKQRSAVLNGHIEINSVPGLGTEIKFSGKLP